MILSFVPLILQLSSFSGYILVFKFLQLPFKSCIFCFLSWVKLFVAFVSNAFIIVGWVVLNHFYVGCFKSVSSQLASVDVSSHSVWDILVPGMMSDFNGNLNILGLRLLDSGSYLSLVFLPATLTLPWWMMEMPPHYWEVRVEVQLLHSDFIAQDPGGGFLGGLLPLSCGESHNSPLGPPIHPNRLGSQFQLLVTASSDIASSGVCVEVTLLQSSQGKKSRFSAVSSLVGLEQQFLWWCLAVVEWLLPKSFLSYWASRFLVLGLERIGFYWAVVCLCPLPFSGYWLLQCLVWDISLKKKTQGTGHWVSHAFGFKFSSHLSERLLLFTLQTSYVCCMYNVPCF